MCKMSIYSPFSIVHRYQKAGKFKMTIEENIHNYSSKTYEFCKKNKVAYRSLDRQLCNVQNVKL